MTYYKRESNEFRIQEFMKKLEDSSSEDGKTLPLHPYVPTDYLRDALLVVLRKTHPVGLGKTRWRTHRVKKVGIIGGPFASVLTIELLNSRFLLPPSD